MTQLKLRPPKHRIEKRAAWLWSLQSFALGVVALGGFVWAYIAWEDQRWWLTVLGVLFAVLTLVYTVIEPWLRYHIHRWEVTDEAVYGLSGWITREWRVAPISRIQTVDAVRGPLEQVFGLSTLRITTASSKGAIEISGLDKDVAAKVAEELTVITEKTPGDAT